MSRSLGDLADISKSIGTQLNSKGFSWEEIGIIGTILHDGANYATNISICKHNKNIMEIIDTCQKIG